MIKTIKNSKFIILFCLLTISSLAFSQGSRYTGTYKKSGPIELDNKSNIVIEGLELSNISIRHSNNITIRNCKLGPTAKKAIYLYKSSNITVIDCEFEEIQTGLLAEYCTGNIKFEHNDVKNIQGERGNESVQMAQFVHLSGPGNSVSFNACENIAGQSSVEDVISMYASNGTANSPIRIANNWIRGGGPSQTSGGIMLGDSGGSHQIAENNILVNPGQYGISISGGHDLVLRNNKAYSKRFPHSNVGMVIWDWWAWKQTDAFPLYNITAENNEFNWTNRDGIINTTYIHPNAGTVKGLSTNKHNPNLNESILPKVILGRANITDDNTPDVETPDDNTPDVETPDDTTNPGGTTDPGVDKPGDITPDKPIFNVYKDVYNRVAIKCLVNPTQDAKVEIHIPAWGNTINQNITGFRTLIDTVLPDGEYVIKVRYGNPVKTETTKISIPGNNVPEDNTPEDNTPEDNTPEDNTPGDNTPGDNTSGDNTSGDTGASKFSISKDSYNRISIKCLATPIQAAKVEIRVPAWGNTITQNINSLNNLIDYSLPAGKYEVKVSYGNPVKTEILKITLN